MAQEDNFMDIPFRGALFRDRHHRRRLEVKPYHRLVVLARGNKPSVLPIGAIGTGWVELVMNDVPDAGDDVDWPVALLMVEAMHLKFIANWETENVDAIIDYLIVTNERSVRAH